MGFFSDLDVDVAEMVSLGFTRDEILAKYPFLTERDLDVHFGREYDYSAADADVISYDDLVSEPEFSDEE